MITNEYMRWKNFNMLYLPKNKIFFVNFNKINEKREWLSWPHIILRRIGYEGDVVLDYRNLKYDGSARFYKLPFKEGQFDWSRAKEIDGLDVYKEFLGRLGEVKTTEYESLY